MNSKTVSRRDFLRLPENESKSEKKQDLLFEKYSRKEFNGRNNYRADSPFFRKDETALKSAAVISGLEPYTGPWTTAEVLHLLRRTTFGFKKGHADSLEKMTLSGAVDQLLQPGAPPATLPVNWYSITAPDINGLAYGADWTNDAQNSTSNDASTVNRNRWEGLKRWSLGLALDQELSIREKMVWFWFHFIPIDFNTVYQSPNKYANTNSARICYQYIKMFRDNAVGNFKTIIREMAKQAAMMFYLNNQANTKTAPDENFAREVMELFTLGKDPLSQYTQQDVVEAAKVLTGWRVQNLNLATTSTDFVSTYHETSNKQFSSFFDNKLITNKGADELTEFIDMIFSKKQVVSEYIIRRLYRYYVYYDIDANVEKNIITPLAKTFADNNWDIKPVLQQLFKSAHFYDMANRGVYIKSPFDLVIGSLRAFNVPYTVANPSNINAQYLVWGYINDSILSPIDQVMGKVPNVSGWPPFYQNPNFHEYWINSDTTQKRYQFLQRIFDGISLTYNGLTTKLMVDVIAFVQQFGSTVCADPDLLVAQCTNYLLPVDLSQAQKDILKTQNLLSNQTSNSYWTKAWNDYAGAPSNTTYKNIVIARLKALLTTITQFAEYQLM